MFLMEWGSFVARIWGIDMYRLLIHYCIYILIYVCTHEMLLIIGMPTPTFGSTMSHICLSSSIPNSVASRVSPNPPVHVLRFIGLRGSNPMNIRHTWLLRIISPSDIFHFAVWVLSPLARIFVSIHGTEICGCAKWLSSYWQGWEIKGTAIGM